MRRAAVQACFVATAIALAGVPAGAADLEYEAYLAELENPDAQFIVVSNHFRHDVGCTSSGCIIMGPTTDREACEEWSRLYNRVDPYDHSKCVESSDYEQVRY